MQTESKADYGSSREAVKLQEAYSRYSLGRWMAGNRRALAVIALAGFLLLGLLGETKLSTRVADGMILAFGLAAIIGTGEVLLLRSYERAGEPRVPLWPGSPSAFGLMVLLTGIASQNWFRAGTVIAVGDTGIPHGLAWIDRLFVPWSGSGSNLGGPSALEQQLPFALILGVTHFVGGSPEIAQRIWFTLLFMGVATGCLTLLVVLGVPPRFGAIGALAYTFSPFVLANAMPNPVYLLAMALMPTMVACILAGATKRIGVHTAIALLAMPASFVGYVYLNPPLVGLLILVTLLSPLAAGWIYGGAAALRASLVVLTGLPLLAIVSSYWVVPAALQLLLLGTPHQLQTVASWAWTEGRATTENALWLNTAWGWAHAEYFPFAAAYHDFPLSLLKFGPAALAFASLALHKGVTRPNRDRWRFRMILLASSVALFTQFLSTGTNPPGNLIFDPLYSLPGGWLLREPGRFLMTADLAFAVLIALSAHMLATRWQRSELTRTIRRAVPTVVIAVTGIAVVLPGWPLISGSSIEDNRPVLPPMHVHFPSYWNQMAEFIDREPLAGAVLILPTNDYYQMPYRWGYVGNDQFIVDLMHRRVINPTTGYFSADAQLSNAAALEGQSILAGEWLVSDRVLRALGAQLILVRGDLDESFPGRSFLSPKGLAHALDNAPNVDFVHSIGPLRLYRLRGGAISDTRLVGYYATVDSNSPNLRILAALPADSAVVTGPLIEGIPHVQEVPDVSHWQLGGQQLLWSMGEPRNRISEIIRLDPGASLESPGHKLVQVTPVVESGRGSDLRFSLPVTDVLANGSFDQGAWGPVGDCNNLSGPAAQPYLSAMVVQTGGPSGGRFLRLSTSLDTACEHERLSWHGGPLLVSMKYRHISGDTPQLCLWEAGLNRCARIPQFNPQTNGWADYQATVVPDLPQGTLDLFVYAAALVPNRVTTNDYADIRVVELPTLPQIDVISSPLTTSSTSTLMATFDSYSSGWTGPAHAKHVRINGLTNGWIVYNSAPLSASYEASNAVQLGLYATALGLIFDLLLLGWPLRKQIVGRVRRLISPRAHA